MNRRYPLGPYGLSLTLGALFLVSWIGQIAAQVIEVGNDAAEHGQTAGWSEMWPVIVRSTLENWQSEFLQLLTFVLLSTWLVHRGSPQSRDGDDQLAADVAELNARVARLEGR